VNNIAMALAVQKAAKPRFRGHKVLKSKVVTHFPDNLTREYMRITNTYMTLLNKTLAEHLPAIRKAIDAEREAAQRQDMRHDADLNVSRMIQQAMMRARQDMEKKAEHFGLERKLENLAKLTRKLSIREWNRVVHKTLGINIFEDYYSGEFYRNTLKLWVRDNVNLIKTIPDKTMTRMTNIINNGFYSGSSNTSIAKQIQEAYGIERRHAQFIARDQMAKLNGEITRQQQEDAGVKEYIWSDSGDVRVRDCHAEHHGKRFKWSDPPEQWYETKTGRKIVGRAHPGQFYNCRCVALPIFDLPGLNLPWEGKQP